MASKLGRASLRRQTILFIRHGESIANVSGQDHHDAKLTQVGIEQASSWRDTAGELGVQVCLCSPLRRAIQTATYVFQDTAVPFQVCRYARESYWHMRQCQGVPHEELVEFVKTLPRGADIDVSPLADVDEVRASGTQGRF